MEEHTLLESDTGEFVLTNKKVRLTSRTFGRAGVKSIMLHELTGCEIKYVSQPWLLVLAAVLAVGGLIAGDSYAIAGLVVGAITVGAYFFFRYQAVVLSSPSTSIKLSVKGMGLDQTVDMIDKVEEAKAAQRPRISHS